METVHVVAINPYRKGNKGKVFSYNIDTYDKVIGSKEIKKMIQQIRGELPIDGVDLNVRDVEFVPTQIPLCRFLFTASGFFFAAQRKRG